MRIFDRFKKPQELAGPETGKARDIGDTSFGGFFAGVSITEESSLTISAFFSAVRIISEDIASLPLHLYLRRNGSRERAVFRPEYDVMHLKPNNYQTAFTLRQAMVANALLRGAAYAEKERNGKGEVIGLHLIKNDDIKTRLTADGELVHDIGGKRYGQDEIFYFPAFSTDGVTGRSLLRVARESLGLSKATEHYGSSYFENGANPGGVLETEKRLTDPDAIERLRESWNSRHKGPKKNGGVAILEDGMTYRQIGIPPEDSQFLETRQFQISEIARWFRLPPHMLGDLENATYSNIEQQSLDYVKYSLRPWLVRLEQEYQRQLLPDALQGPYYFEHNVDGLLRGDVESRYNAYAVGRQWGWLSANDIRRMENMNLIDGGDDYLVPLNMTGGADNEGE